MHIQATCVWVDQNRVRRCARRFFDDDYKERRWNLSDGRTASKCADSEGGARTTFYPCTHTSIYARAHHEPSVSGMSLSQ